jgi:hypothetical protein
LDPLLGGERAVRYQGGNRKNRSNKNERAPGQQTTFTLPLRHACCQSRIQDYGLVHVYLSSSIDTHQQKFRFLVWALVAGLWAHPQLPSAKSCRSGDRGTCRAQPLHHPEIFDIPTGAVVGLTGGLEKLPHWAGRIDLTNAAYNRRWLAIRGVSTWIE